MHQILTLNRPMSKPMRNFDVHDCGITGITRELVILLLELVALVALLVALNAKNCKYNYAEISQLVPVGNGKASKRHDDFVRLFVITFASFFCES